ncbi:hypothetical protein BH11PLA2_BH11PLA2_14910 [soil metagenome]
MAQHPSFDRDECIEQAYFFRTFRERLAEGVASQDILTRMDEELLSTTKLPMATQFLASELKHSGLLGSGFARLSHYFTPFQTFIIRQSEDDKRKFNIVTALLFLEREAVYKSTGATPAGLFVYHFETVSRNKLGYDDGLKASSEDPIFDKNWQEYIDVVRRQVGTYDFSDLVYLRSALHVADVKRKDATYEPSQPPLFADKEGKIAKASRGRDPLFLFAALQRQLGYPEVPRSLPTDGVWKQIELMQNRMKEMELRLKITESEVRGTFDPTQFGKPELFKDDNL